MSPRLLSVCGYIKTGRLYDIGTDHGFVPVYAVLNLGVKNAVASDIVRGPLSKAEALIKTNRLEDKIKTVLCDGPDGLEIIPPCDIVIAGMGGELISSMVERTEAFCDQNVNLVLQPMTKSEVLRSTLINNGFEIISEEVVSDKKLYSVINAVYADNTRSYTEAETLLGKRSVQKNEARYDELINEKLSRLIFNKKQKEEGGHDTKNDAKLIEEIKKL